MFDLWFERFNGLGDQWAVWMATATIEALVVLLVVGTIWLLIRRRVAPQVGVWLFLLVPLKLLIPIQVPAPALIANWTPSAIVTKLTSPQISAPQLQQESSENTRVTQLQPRETLETEIATILPVVTSVAQDDAPPFSGDILDVASLPGPINIAATSKLSWKLTSLLMFAWATVVSFLGLRFLLREIRFRRQLTSSARLTNKDLNLDFQALVESAGVHRSVRLLSSETVTAPAVHGILRPSIILPPSALQQLSPAQLRWALLHELSHVRRHDLAFILLQRVMSWLFFFHPAIWIANRIVHQLREFACDDWAILQTEPTQSNSPSTDAGEAFLQILRSASQPQRNDVALSVLGLGPRESCQQRLQRMLDTDRCIKPGPGWVSICGLLLVAAVALPQLSAANPDEPVAEPVVAQTDKNADAEEKPATPTPTEDAWRFDLHVVDTEGSIVPKAQIRINDYLLPEVKQVLAGKQGEKDKFGIAFQCDRQGRLSVRFSDRPDVFHFTIEADGFGPFSAGWRSTNLANQIPSEFTAELEDAWTVGGQVVDEAGAPIEGATVSLRVEFKKRDGDQGQLTTSDQLTTDADGRWIFRRVPNSMNGISAEINSENHQPRGPVLMRDEFEINPDDESRSGGTIVLPQGLDLSGKVLNGQGEPVEGAEVRVRFINSVRRSTTGMDGRYKIGSCCPGDIEARVSKPGMAVEKKYVSIVPNGEDVDFVIKPSKGIRIRVIDEAGKPLARSRIFFQKWRGDHAFSVLDDVNQYTDDNGVWEWKEAPLDEFTADIGRPQGMNLSGQTLLARDEEYVFSPPPQLYVSGSVTDATTGEKVKTFRVMPGVDYDFGPDKIRRWWQERNAFTSSDGTYRIKHSRQTCHAHLVRIEADGYKPFVSRKINSDEGEVTLDFKLEPAEMISTQIVDSKGNPAVDADVVIGTNDSSIEIHNGDLVGHRTSSAPQFKTNENGNVKFPPRLEPFHLIILHDKGFARVVTEDNVLPKQVTLTAWGMVKGEYLIGNKPAKAGSVELSASQFESQGDGLPSVWTRYQQTTDGSGNFNFDRVFPGNNTIHWKEKPGWSEASSSRLESLVVKEGQIRQLRLGASGVPIVGRLTPPKDFGGPIDWSKSQLILRQATVSVRVAQVFGEAAEPEPERQPYYYFTLKGNKDGTFRFEDVPAGNWSLGGEITDGDVRLTVDSVNFTIASYDKEQRKIGEVATRRTPSR